jgi:hypothetical protein
MRKTHSARRGAAPVFTIVIVLLVVALATEAVMMMRPRRPAIADTGIKNNPNAVVSYFGTKTAPIQIEFYAPLMLEWHKKTIGLLREWDKKHPGQLGVKLMPMGNAECDPIMDKRGFVCAVIFINGKHEFTLPSGTKVDLQKRPNTDGAFYNSEDVITILDHWGTVSKTAPK